MAKLRVFSDTTELGHALAKEFMERASASERFSVALAGGSTPRGFYELLATDYGDRVPWERIHFFWSDERYMPLDHADRHGRFVLVDLLI